jgi:HK97 family phage major capsid protein
MPTAAIMAPRSLVGFGNLADTTNQPLQRPGTIENMRFIATSAIPVNLTTGTSTDTSEIYCGDFTTVKFVMRERPSIQLLMERYADSGQIGFVCHVRADVVVTYPSTLAVITGVRP